MRRDDRVRVPIAWEDGQPSQYATGYVVAVNDDGDLTIQWDGGAVETLAPTMVEGAT